MSDKHQAVADALREIEAALRAQRLWHHQPPSAEALNSTAPFAVDTLSFTQWLQFVFLPQMQRLVNRGGALPTNCAITPMAQEYCRQQAIAAAPFIKPLQRLDSLLTDT
jgi:uncharacterized protein YqcC (DUF446 family)